MPTDDPAVKSALAYLLKINPKFNYVVCLKTMVLAQADPVKYALEINKNVAWLEAQQNAQICVALYTGRLPADGYLI